MDNHSANQPTPTSHTYTSASSSITSPSTSAASVASPSSSSSRTLIHFKKNSRHAVSQALSSLNWTEVRIRLPKTKGTKAKTRSTGIASPSAPLASSPTLDDDDDGNSSDSQSSDGEAPTLIEDREVDAASLAVAAAAVSEVQNRPKKVKQPKSFLLNLSNYSQVSSSSNSKKLVPIGSDLQWDIAWMDLLSEAEYRSLTLAQRINQFPLMHRLTKKKFLALNLNRMRQLEPDEYAFYPRSWVLPQEIEQVKEHYRQLQQAATATSDGAASGSTSVQSSGRNWLPPTPILIVKPDFACEGKGIYLVDRLSAIDMSIPIVVQEYIDRPLLLENKAKWDLRLYVLITSVSPLSIFLFDDGLTRFCTDEYVAPKVGALGSTYQHLTNYAINKKNVDKFVYPTEKSDTPPDAQSDADAELGNKWSVKHLMAKLRREGREVDQLWREIGDLVNKSIISAIGTLTHAYKTTFSGAASGASSTIGDDGGMCFQFLGFDILLTDAFKPTLIEINRNCSLKCDTPLDTRIKVRAISQTLQMVDPRAPYRYKSKETLAKEREQLRQAKGAEYKELQANLLESKYHARLRYEDACVAKFQSDEHGGWHRIHPAVMPWQKNKFDDSDATPPMTEASSSNSDSPPAWAIERQAVYDRLIQLSLGMQSDVKPKRSTPAASSASSIRSRLNRPSSSSSSSVATAAALKSRSKRMTPTPTAGASSISDTSAPMELATDD